MNKLIAITTVCLLSSIGYAADNYELEVNGESHDIRIDTETQVTLSDGTTLNLKLVKKNDIEYKRPYFSFSHSGTFKIATTDLGDGLFQTLMTTPDGTFILIQEHTDMDPSFMLDPMIEELTRPEVAAGYEIKETEITRKVGTSELKGKKIVSTGEGGRGTREVCTIGGDECGLLIVTAILQSNADEQVLIDGFWKNLRITLP